MVEFGVYFYEIGSLDKEKLTLGVAFTDSEENGISQLSKFYSNLNYIKFVELWDWNRFKSIFDTSKWPDSYKNNDTGLFKREDFADVCSFAKDIYIPVLNAHLSRQ